MAALQIGLRQGWVSGAAIPSLCSWRSSKAGPPLPLLRLQKAALFIILTRLAPCPDAVQFSSVAQSCPTLCDPMDSLSITWSLLRLMSIESVMPSNHLILCHPLLPPSIFPSIRVFSNELVLCIRWPKYWSFSFSISPSNEYSGLISFRMDWLDLLAVQGTLKPSPTPQFKSINSLVLRFLYSPTLISVHDYCPEAGMVINKPSRLASCCEGRGSQDPPLWYPDLSPSVAHSALCGSVISQAPGRLRPGPPHPFLRDDNNDGGVARVHTEQRLIHRKGDFDGRGFPARAPRLHLLLLEARQGRPALPGRGVADLTPR